MSLLQEALKRKEDDEAQRKPETVSAEKSPAALPPDDANLSAGRREADGKNTFIPQDSPPQSMPVLAPPQSAASQPAHRSLGAGGPILAPRSAIALPPSRSPLWRAKEGRDGESAEPSRLGEVSPLADEARVAKPGRRKISSLWVIVAAIAILTGLTVAAGFTFFLYRCLSPIKAGIGQQTHHTQKVDTIIAGGSNIVVGQPIPADRRETMDSTEAMTHQFVASDALVPKPQSEKGVEKDSIVTAARTQAVAVTQNAESNAVQQQSVGDAARKPVSVKPAPARVKTPRASSSAVRWPALKLTGILRGSGPAESTALINGKMISAGQTIEGVTIVEIQANGVLLKHGSEKRFLRVGATLY